MKALGLEGARENGSQGCFSGQRAWWGILAHETTVEGS